MSIFVNKVEIYAFQIATAATLSVIKNHNKREFVCYNARSFTSLFEYMYDDSQPSSGVNNLVHISAFLKIKD